MSRITVHIGHYGSGKTELSLNKAYQLAANGEKITLVDLDIVNPYFRSGEHKDALESHGIKVIRPNFEGTNVAVPSIPASIMSVFVDKSSKVIFDVGGDPSGAAALGRYHQAINSDDSQIKCIVNTLRPFTSTSQEIVEMVRLLEQRSRLKVDTLVNNTNVARETTLDMIINGQRIIEEAGNALGLDVSEIGIIDELLIKSNDEFISKNKDIITRVKLYMRKEWMDMCI